MDGVVSIKAYPVFRYRVLAAGGRFVSVRKLECVYMNIEGMSTNATLVSEDGG